MGYLRPSGSCYTSRGHPGYAGRVGGGDSLLMVSGSDGASGEMMRPHGSHHSSVSPGGGGKEMVQPVKRLFVGALQVSWSALGCR